MTNFDKKKHYHDLSKLEANKDYAYDGGIAKIRGKAILQ